MRLIPTNTKRNDCIQTPIALAQQIVAHFNPSGKILEPCKGDGNFLTALPKETEWCEILEGRDFFTYKNKVDWVITNPPYSQMRKFMQKSMQIADNVVFLTTINHLWLKARLRDVDENGFGIREIIIFNTPDTFPASGFQIGVFHLQRNYIGEIKYTDWRVKVII